MKGLYILNPEAFSLIYGPEERQEIESRVEMAGDPQTPESVMNNPGLLEDIDVVFSGWGGPRMDAAFLDRAPRLKMVFYGAGSIRGIVTDEFWDRGIRITSAYGANGVPVAEYTLAQILLALKRTLPTALDIRRQGRHVPPEGAAGAYGSTVGILSLGLIGRRVCQLLKLFDVKVVAYDPYVKPAAAEELGVELCSLEEVFRRADVVSLHTPWLKETENLIRGDHFKSMKPYATFINTARGAVVCEPEMTAILEERPDLFAVLDVTWPEPPVEGSPLYTLPNVLLTPHIAGSMGMECRRMARFMGQELHRYLEGQPLKWEITREKAAVMA